MILTIFYGLFSNQKESTQFPPDLFASYYQLPKKKHHKDPFDRLLIWQAIKTGMTIITRGRRMKEYIEEGLKIQLGR